MVEGVSGAGAPKPSQPFEERGISQKEIDLIKKLLESLEALVQSFKDRMPAIANQIHIKGKS